MTIHGYKEIVQELKKKERETRKRGTVVLHQWFWQPSNEIPLYSPVAAYEYFRFQPERERKRKKKTKRNFTAIHPILELSFSKHVGPVVSHLTNWSSKIFQLRIRVIYHEYETKFTYTRRIERIQDPRLSNLHIFRLLSISPLPRIASIR